MTISRAFLVGALFALPIASCMNPVEDSGDVVGTGEELSSVLSIDFTGYKLGPLGSPWTVNTVTGGTVNVVSTSDHGNVLKAHFEEASGISASTAMVASGPNLDFQFDVKAGSTTAFVLEIKGSRTSAYGSTRTLHFKFDPGGQFSDDHTGVCGTIPVNKWTHVRLFFHTDTPTKVYDAWVDGVQKRPFVLGHVRLSDEELRCRQLEPLHLQGRRPVRQLQGADRHPVAAIACLWPRDGGCCAA